VLNILSRSTALAVPLAEAKLALRVDQSDDDDRIEALVRSETQRYEDFTRRRMVLTEIEASFCSFAEPLALGASPLRTVSEVAYLDGDHVRQTVDAAFYYTSRSSIGEPEIRFTDAFLAPMLSNRPYPVRVVFVAGLDDILASDADPDFLPEESDKASIMRLVSSIFDHGKFMTDSEMRAEMATRRKFL
jgi:hypothetical protein